MLHKIYIGHNNSTKKLETLKALKIVNKYFEGYTSYKGLGYWQGKAEKTLILEIETTNNKTIVKCCKELADKLKQQAIGLAKIGEMQFISV